MAPRSARHLFGSLFVSLLVWFSMAACARAALTSDQGVSAALERSTGRGLSDRHPCVDRLDSVDVIVVGDFAYDHGCMLRGAFINGTWLDAEQLASKALGKLGWTKLTSTEREQTGRVFIEEVILYGQGRFMRYSHEAFSLSDTPSFEEPKVWSKGSEVKVIAWLHEPSGMMPIEEFRQVEVTIDSKGQVRSRGVSSFSVPMKRLR